MNDGLWMDDEIILNNIIARKVMIIVRVKGAVLLSITNDNNI